MAKEYVPIFFDWLEVTQDLTAEEKGNLIDAVVAYASGAEYEHLLTGACRVAFRFMKGQVDRNAKISEARTAAGSNKPEQNGTKDNKPEQNESKDSKPEQNGSNFPKENNNNNNNNNKKEKEKEKENFIDDDNARAIQSEQNRVLDAAEDAGFLKSNSVRAKLLNLYAVHGLEKMLAAFDSCVKHGAPNIAYLEAVLKGEPKKPSKKPQVIAQAYEQRDYATDPDYKAWEERNQRELEEAIAKMEREKKVSSA